VLAGLEQGVLDRVPTVVLARVIKTEEPEYRCRALVVKILSHLGPQAIPLLGVALSDESSRVRMLAAEAIGDVGHAAGIAYLLPRLTVDDPAEYEASRSSLARLTGHDDRGPDAPVLRLEEVDASREAWRRWRLSDAGRPKKVEAIQEIGTPTFPEAFPERYLVEFVDDPTFEVMREAYLALRRLSERPVDAKQDPVGAKMLPRYPRYGDEAVTRANMRTIQDRVREWWHEWLVERRAFLKAGGH
jgi:hypothetical protein